jgi:predicted lysophospholipase L1 biosynthesis ABC-type transport system permease subunit
MSYRPYPDRDRALKQIDRHYPPASAVALSPALRSVGEGFQQIRSGLRRGAEQGLGAGAYVLSTRRPGVVGGGA